MDNNEIIALTIVALAALLTVRCFMGKKGGGSCCSKGCLKPKDSPEKK